MTAHASAERAFGAFDRASHLMSLNLETANSIFEDAMAYAAALSQAEDTAEVAALQATRPVRAVEKAVAYCSGVYGLSEPKDKVAQLIEAQFWASTSPVGAALEQVVDSKHEGENPVNGFEPGLAATLAALDRLLKTSRRSAELAQLELDLAAESLRCPARGSEMPGAKQAA